MPGMWAFINNDNEIWQMSAEEPEICWEKHHVLGCPFCDGDPAPLDENAHTSCTNIACGSTAYMHVDAWNTRLANPEINARLFLLRCLADELTFRNVEDHRLHLIQAIDRLGKDLGATYAKCAEVHPASPSYMNEDDDMRAQQADFESHVQRLRSEREWE